MSARAELRNLLGNNEQEQKRRKKSTSDAPRNARAQRASRRQGEPLVLIQGGCRQTIVVKGDLYIMVGGEAQK